MPYLGETVTSMIGGNLEEIREFIPTLLAGFVPAFIFYTIIVFIITKMLGYKLNVYHWTGITLVSLMVSPIVGLVVTFSGWASI